MKVRIVLFLCLSAISNLQAAQKDSLNSKIPKFFIGLSVSGSNTKTEIGLIKLDNTTLNIVPFFGYRLDRFVFGLGINNNYFKKNSEELDLINGFYTKSEQGKAFSMLPTIRYYSKFNVFLSASYIYGKGFGDSKIPVFDSYRSYNLNLSSKSEIIGATAALGYAIKAGKSFLIEPQVNFYFTTINTDYTLKYEQIGNNPNYNFKNTYNKYSDEEKIKNYLLGIGITYRF